MHARSVRRCLTIVPATVSASALLDETEVGAFVLTEKLASGAHNFDESGFDWRRVQWRRCPYVCGYHHRGSPGLKGT